MEHLITKYDLDEITECPICMLEYQVNDPTIITSCGHIYHKKCINNWVIKTDLKKCPICRKLFNSNFFDKLTIDKWTDKGKKMDLKNKNLYDNLSVKNIRKISQSLYLKINGCYDKNDFIQIIQEYMNNLTIRQIKNYLNLNKIDYSNLIEKEDLLLLYQIFVIRSCGI